MADKKKPKLVPPALTVKVTCTAGHKLSGLFVIFKLVPQEGETKEQKLARILEATPHPGDPPVEPAPLTAEQQKDKVAKDAYKKAKTEYDKAKKAWDDAKALYDGSIDKETPPDPADRFVLGIVNHKGYLVPVHTAYNPWYDVVTTPGRDPDAYKLLSGEKYEVCLLRHPSPAVARALTRHLNKKPDSGDAKYGFGAWGTLTHTVEVVTESGGGGAEVALKLSEDPADYVPKGADRYGKWTIYRAMPHRRCPALASPMEKVQQDLGLLRYPVGGHGSPFSPMAYTPNDDAEKKEEGGFDRQVQAAAARFQENVNEGKATLLTHKDQAHGGKDWAHVFGKPFDLATATDETVKWAKLSHATFMLGLIDVETTARIEHWIQHGLRKPGEVLIPSVLGYGIWMLERGEIALTAWTKLVEALGCHYGVKPGSSLRSVRVFAWDGAINNSVHKSGLAMDTFGGADRYPDSKWPIRYEAHWVKDERKAARELTAAEKAVATAKADLEKKKLKGDAGAIATAEEAVKKAELQVQRVKADDSDSKFYWRMRWRVYGHSDLDLFNPAKRATEIARLKKSLADYAGVPDPAAPPADPSVPAPPATPPRGTLWKALKDSKLKGVDGKDVEEWLDVQVKPFAEYAKTLLGKSGEDLIKELFRYEVVQFIPNPYESDGGTSLRKYKPTEGDGEFPAESWARSWLNLSALAYPCQMETIGPHSMDFRDQVWVRGKDHKKAQFKAWSMAGYFTVTADENADMVMMLGDITASEADAPQLKHRDTDIPILRGGSTVATYKPADLDGKFIKVWKEEARKLDPTLRPRAGKGAGSADAHGAQIAVILAATDKGKAKVQAAIDLLKGKVGANNFVVTHAGDLAKVDVAPGVIVTGKALSEKLTKGLADFEAQATANAKKAADEEAKKKADEEAAQKKAADDAAAAGKPPPKPPVKTKKQIADEKKARDAAAAATEKKLVTDWTVVIQPIFPKKADAANLTFLPDDSVLLPPGSNAAHLEWWHFQHRSAGPTWGSLLEECGYSLEVMTVPLEGNAGPDGTPVHLGLGYTKAEAASSPGAFNEGPVENSDPSIPAGG